MDKADYCALVFVVGFAVLLGYGVAKEVIGIGQAAVVATCLLLAFALAESVSRPPPVTLINEEQAEPAQERFPIGFQPPS